MVTTLATMVKRLDFITNIKKKENTRNLLNKYKEKIKHSIKNYYAITGIIPKNYPGSIPNRSGLYKTFTLYNSIRTRLFAGNIDGTKKTVGRIYAVDYADDLINMRNGRYDFVSIAKKGTKLR